MTKAHVYINTRDRYHLLAKTIPRWLAQEPDGLTLVIEPDQYFHHRTFLREHGWWPRIQLLRLSRKDSGLGNSRREMIEHAAALGHKAILTSDDDHYPHKDDDIRDLISFAASGKTMGVGACVPIYGLSLGNDFIRETNEPVPVLGSWGYAVYALNVPLVMKAGNFNPNLKSGWEDQELCRHGIAIAGKQWHIHTGVRVGSMAKRYEPGGCQGLFPTPEARAAEEKRCHTICHKRWPNYVSTPDKKYRCAWRRMLVDFGVLK